MILNNTIGWYLQNTTVDNGVPTIQWLMSGSSSAAMVDEPRRYSEIVVPIYCRTSHHTTDIIPRPHRYRAKSYRYHTNGKHSSRDSAPRRTPISSTISVGQCTRPSFGRFTLQCSLVVVPLWPGHRTDHDLHIWLPLHDLDISGQIGIFLICMICMICVI